jgi:predicted DCC family thiol-disulfide oxidoreductase YuxK
LLIAGKLKFPWSMALFFLIIPKALRDLFYLGVAGIRYRWFGKKETCSLPKAENLGRFL